MSLKSFLGKIGNFFASVFQSIEKVWKKVSPEVQNALLKGSGIIEIINSNPDLPAAEVLEKIETAFPDLLPEDLYAALQDTAKGLNLAAKGDAVAVLGIIQKYLNKLEGTGWAKASKYAAEFIAQFLAPSDTKSSLVGSLIEFVYQKFIKDKIKI